MEYDNFKKLISQKLSERRQIRIEHVVNDGSRDNTRTMSLIAEHVHSELKEKIKGMFGETNDYEYRKHYDTQVEHDKSLTQQRLQRHLLQELLFNRNQYQQFDITVQSGSQFIGPPYDEEWSTGTGFAWGAINDGKVIVVSEENNFSAAGVGFYLTTNETVLASVTPQGTYDWSWIATKDLPFIQSSGGMGITVYENANAQPLLSRQPILWSINGITVPRVQGYEFIAADNGRGMIADAASPAFGFGSVPLAPALFNMNPGSEYLVWVWCWQVAKFTENAFIAFLQFEMPFVTINVGPPILLH